jgi:hypothetical protein
MKIVGLIGVPGTGKTTLTRAWMKQHASDWQRAEPRKLVTCEYSPSRNTYILGKYDEGEVFAGTDKLSMSVMPEAKIFLKECDKSTNIFFEGDRLGSASFFEYIMDLPKVELHILKLQADSRTLSIRYSERGSNQSEQFLSGRETKISNICNNFNLMDCIETLYHETPEDTAKAVEWIESKF